jgi:CRP/FNR family transcriptional regulator, anaerobic regulatory protein
MSTVGNEHRDRCTQDVFSSLSDRETSLIETLTLRAVTLPANRLLVGEGEVGNSLYQVTRGWAYRYRNCTSTSRQIIDFLLPGELVGLGAALLGVTDHSVRTLTPLHACAIDARVVGKAFRAEPAFALRLARYVGAEAERVAELLTMVGCGDAVERLAFLMLSLYRRQARRGHIDPLNTPFPLRRQHMADALGLTGAHINRTLNRLRQDGIAIVENRCLSIRDLPRLAALVEVATA